MVVAFVLTEDNWFATIVIRHIRKGKGIMRGSKAGERIKIACKNSNRKRGWNNV